MNRYANRKSSADSAISDYVASKMTKRIKSLVEGAVYDLHYGPLTKSEAKAQGIANWPGFSAATKEISEWLRESDLTELWYDDQSGDVLENAPEGFQDGDEWIEPEWNDYTKYESRDVKRAVFGELGEYV